MPEEEMLVAVVAIIATSVVILKIVGMIAGWLGGSSKRGDDDSLTAGELERLVRAAVRSETRDLQEETRELHRELRRLQRRVGQTRRLEPPEDPHRYGLLADTESIDEPEGPA